MLSESDRCLQPNENYQLHFMKIKYYLNLLMVKRPAFYLYVEVHGLDNVLYLSLKYKTIKL